MAKHYTGILEILEVEEGRAEGRDPISRRITPATERRKGEVARIVVRAASLTDLKRKMAAHVELVGDGDNELASVAIERKPR